MGVIKDAQFIPDESLFQLDNISSIKNQLSCACQCWSNSMCVTATYQGTNKTCSLFSAQLWQGQLSSIITNKNTTTITFANRSVPGKLFKETDAEKFLRVYLVYGVNMLMNGDAETGPCEMGNNITHPTEWSYIGGITQMSYNDTEPNRQNYITPGLR
jgi:hypothetical protein